MSWKSPQAPPGIRHNKQWNHLLDALDHTEYLTAVQAADKAEIAHRRAINYLRIARVLGLVEQVKRRGPHLYRLNGKP
ncbi:MAG: hypothetical protein JSV57_01280 [Candidatus Bathyarchaeota archaeon]|nr:MAG: hypothetical protein JSV57_01280 [Candidatus Bathyarchaeota archaeon]